MIKAKLKAAGIHSIVSLFVALSMAVLIFGLWYPDALSEMVSGIKLFMLIVLVELVLGPLMSLIIFNPSKPQKELILDYAVIAAVQLSALAYGLSSVVDSRPIFLVFVLDRIEVVSAIEVDSNELRAANISLPWFGPKLICTERPQSSSERIALLESSLKGKDIQFLPKYYRDCRPGEIKEKLYAKASWTATTGKELSVFPERVQSQDFGWLPIVRGFVAWVMVYPQYDLSSPIYFDVDPFPSTSNSQSSNNLDRKQE
jgi:hypothetical protein